MAQEQLKFLNPRKIEVEVQKLDGSSTHLECERITAEMVQQTNKAASEAERDPAGSLCRQMMIFFGGSKDDYREYDARVLMQVIRWMTEQIRNPT